MSKWTFILMNKNVERLGEIRNATERNVVLAMGKPSTASFVIRADNPLVPSLFADDTELLVYEEKTLRFRGLNVTVEMANADDGTGLTVRVNAADGAWEMSKWIVGESATGTKHTAQDKGSTAGEVIAEGGLGRVTTGAEGFTNNSGSIGTYTVGPYRTALSVVNDLATGIDGFDWRIEPYFNDTIGNEARVGIFHAAAVFGSTKPAVFEYGWGRKNVRHFSYIKDMDTMANRAIHLPDNGLEAGAVVTAEDAISIGAHGGVPFETIAEASGILDVTMRQKLVEEHVAVRKEPRRVLAMTFDLDDGTGRVPVLGTDYWLGDFVTIRGVEAGLTIFNGKVRIYQINVSLNDAGTATITPILVDDENEL